MNGQSLQLQCPPQATEVQLGLADLTSTVVFTLELQEFEAPKSTWNLGEQEKLDYAAARKDRSVGSFFILAWVPRSGTDWRAGGVVAVVVVAARVSVVIVVVVSFVMLVEVVVVPDNVQV